MNNVVGASYVLTGKDIFSASNALMAGRIINVRFTRKNGESFTIRSDYEPIFDGKGIIRSFKRCSPPPSITLSYDPVANDVAINVKLSIDALYIDRAVSGAEIDSSSGNPVVWAYIQLGYIDQFPDWTRIAGMIDVNRYYDMDENILTTGQGVLGGRAIMAQVLTCTPVSNPPDMRYEFKCCVGTLDTGLRWDHSEEELTENYGDNDYQKLSEIEVVLFQWITRRFIRPSIEHITSTERVEQGGGSYTIEQRVAVRGYRAYGGALDESSAAEMVDITDNLKKGILGLEDAANIGIRCLCSQVLKSMRINELFRYATIGEKATFMTIPTTPYDDPQDTVGAQLRSIQSHYQFLRWYQLRDGSFYFYHVQENDASLYNDPYVKEMQKENLQGLPAIYDMTMSGMRIIRCPFYTVIDPMTTVIFQSRYRLLDTTGFYYQPAKGIDAFLVILASIEFSTAGEENTMTLKCVDIPVDAAPEVDTSTGKILVKGSADIKEKADYVSGMSSIQEERNKAWAKGEVEAGKDFFGMVPTSWIPFAQMLIQSADPLYWGTERPTIERALTDLKEWNKDGVWTDSRIKDSKTGYSYDNGRVDVKKLGFYIPWLYAGDKVIVRVPYRNQYDSSFEKKEIVING